MLTLSGSIKVSSSSTAGITKTTGSGSGSGCGSSTTAGNCTALGVAHETANNNKENNAIITKFRIKKLQIELL